MDTSSDYLMRMIIDVSRGLNMLLRRSEQSTIPTPTNAIGDDEMLPEILKGLVAQGQIDQAENLLFRCLENYPLAENYALGLDFYEHLCSLDEQALRAAGWSRNEIKDGLTDLYNLLEPELPPDFERLQLS